jgi:hypothetical protein
MTVQPIPGLPKPGPLSPLAAALLTPRETAKRLQVSLSWLAKARMRGDGPPFIKIGPFDPLQRSCLAAVDEVAAAIVDQRAVKSR